MSPARHRANQRILAIASFAMLLSGFASLLAAQGSQTSTPFSCSASVSIPPTLRIEGFTELVGDLTLTCSGGTPTPQIQPIPAANFIVKLNTALFSSGCSEALLLIDEPAAASVNVQPCTLGSLRPVIAGPSTSY